MSLIIAPAYGRDYIRVSQASNDWHDNKDFIIVSGPYKGAYINKSEAIEAEEGIVKILYDKRSKYFVQQV